MYAHRGFSQSFTCLIVLNTSTAERRDVLYLNTVESNPVYWVLHLTTKRFPEIRWRSARGVSGILVE